MNNYSKNTYLGSLEYIDMSLNNIADSSERVDRDIDRLRIDCYIVALYNFFSKHNLECAKQYFYLQGRASEIYTYITDLSDHLKFSLDTITYNLLSDNKNLIMRYSLLQGSMYDEHRKEGGLIYCIQAIIRDDWFFLKEQIAINEDKILSKSRGKWIEPDHLFFVGMMEKNQQKIEEAINFLLIPKQHKKRNKEFIYNNEFISIPALTYTKLAWFKGIEVEIDNPLVPKELLPITPNKEYWEYDFMKWDKFKCSS